MIYYVRDISADETLLLLSSISIALSHSHRRSRWYLILHHSMVNETFYQPAGLTMVNGSNHSMFPRSLNSQRRALRQRRHTHCLWNGPGQNEESLVYHVAIHTNQYQSRSSGIWCAGNHVQYPWSDYVRVHVDHPALRGRASEEAIRHIQIQSMPNSKDGFIPRHSGEGIDLSLWFGAAFVCSIRHCSHGTSTRQ